MPEVEVKVPQQENSAGQQPPAPEKKLPAKKRNPRKTRNMIIALVVVAALAVGGVFLYQFLTKQQKVNSEIQTSPVSFGSIQSKVTGSGNAMAKESAAITLTAGGTVEEVFVTSGDTVTAGQPLYTISSKEAQDKLDNLNAEMKDLLE